jgi:riboflavin synthase alpha subunit
LKKTGGQEIIFKGLIEGVGKVLSITSALMKIISTRLLQLNVGDLAETITAGEPYFINGICLTVREVNESIITVHVWPITNCNKPIILLLKPVIL